MTTLQTLTVAGLTSALAASSIVPTTAAPFFMPNVVTAHSDVIQVRDGVRWRRGWNNRGWNNGYRGYRNHHYNNGWYPAGAAIAGAIIGGAIANSYYNRGYYVDSYYDDGYDGNGYYGNGYYGDAHDSSRYYGQRVYYPRGNAYRRGYADGYRAGRYGSIGGGITCTPRLADAGRC